MPLDEQVFSDGIGSITVIGGTVRLDFVAYSPTEKDDNGQPAPAFRQRVIMSVDAFLRSFAKLQEVVNALSKRPAGRPQADTPPEPASKEVSETGTAVPPQAKHPFP